MNAPVLTSRLPQERFTVAQILALMEKGLLLEDAKFELLDGEIVPVSPKGPLHEDVRFIVNRWLARLPEELGFLAETTLYLDEKSFLEPDFVVFTPRQTFADFKAHDVKLAIEVAHDSWSYDIGDKAQRYAKHGVNEYWVINAPKRVIRVHRSGAAGGWAEISNVAAGESVAPICAPDLPFRFEKP